MEMVIDRSIIQTVGLGTIAGIRTTVAPAVASHFLNQQSSKSLKGSNLKFMQTSRVSILTKLLSAVEFVGDKLPNAPNRTSFLQLLPRIASGALVGATIHAANKKSIMEGVILGGVSALAATFVSFYARKYFGGLAPVNDAVAGAVEDAIAVAGGVGFMNYEKVLGVK